MPLRPFQPSEPGCIEVVFHFTLFGIPLAIVIMVCLDSGAAPTALQVASVAAVCDNWMHFDLMGTLSRDLVFLQTVATDTSVSTGFQSTVNHGAGISGSILQDALPSQIAIEMVLYTALRGRNYRGKTFIPGIPTSYQVTASNSVDVASAATVAAAYVVIDTRLAAIPAKQAVRSRTLLGVRRPVALSQVVTGRNLSPVLNTLRRRSAAAHR